MRFTDSLFLGLVLATGSPALAQDTGTPAVAPTPALTVGATVYDAAGGEVGTIDSVSGEIVVVSTGAAKVSLSAKSFGAGPKGPAIAMTKAQLETAAAQAATEAAAAVTAKLVPGATIHGVGGSNVVGTVKDTTDQFVDVTTPRGDVRLPRSAFTLGANGAIIIGMSAAEFDAAVAAAK